MEDEMTRGEFKYFLLSLSASFYEMSDLLNAGRIEELRKKIDTEKNIISDALK